VKDDRKYLLHILECIRRIEDDVACGQAEFDVSHTIQDAVIRNLQVMAESTKRLSDELRAKQPEIDWAGIAGFRNVLVHDYFTVDAGVVWKSVMDDVPVLKAAVTLLVALQV
jgi:uncharacterized protein with HEPN domain